MSPFTVDCTNMTHTNVNRMDSRKNFLYPFCPPVGPGLESYSEMHFQ